MRPVVGGSEHSSGAEDGFALVRQVWHVGELMAVEFEDVAQGLLLVPLAAQALRNIWHVEEEHLDLRLC